MALGIIPVLDTVVNRFVFNFDSICLWIDKGIKMTLEEQIRCVKREIDYRKRLYPVWVQNGKMTQNDANYQIECMECVLSSLVVLHKFQLDIIAKSKENLK